jgi:hypothetical protein
VHRFEEFAAPESATWDCWHDLRNVLRRGLNLSAQLYRALNSPDMYAGTWGCNKGIHIIGECGICFDVRGRHQEQSSGDRHHNWDSSRETHDKFSP